MIIGSSFSGRLVHLTHAVQMYKAEQLKPVSTVDTDLLMDMEGSLVEFQAAAVFHAEKNRLWKEALADRDLKVALLSKTVSEFWRSLRISVSHLDADTRRFGHFGLVGGRNPPGTLRALDWVYYGNLVVTGEAKAVEAGFPALVTPTAEKVAALLEPTETAILNVSQAVLELKAAKAELGSQSAKAHFLLRRLGNWLRYAFHDMAGSTLRDIQRSYLYRFKTASQEEPEPGTEPGTEPAEEPDTEPGTDPAEEPTTGGGKGKPKPKISLLSSGLPVLINKVT